MSVWRCVGLLCVLTACKDKATDSAAAAGGGDSAEPQESLDPGTVPLAGQCPMDADLGGFAVISASEGGGVQGVIGDGVVPITVLTEVIAVGDCRLLRRENPFCDPPCDPGDTCGLDDTCVAYPVNQDLGTVSVSGLVADVVMEPVIPGNTYYDTSLATPPFEPGGVITLSMPDGVYGPVELHGVGVEPLTVSDAEWVIESGVDLTVAWSAPTASVVRSEIAVSIAVDQHGSSPGVIRCVFPDTGSATVPGAIIESLVSSGVTGFPSGSMDRRTVDSVDVTGGCVDFAVSAPSGVDVDVVGFTPCVSDTDCPDGEACNIEMQICEPID